jgi:tight adherence protein B
MMELVGGNAFQIMLVLVFVAVLLLLEGSYLMWQSYRGAEVKRIGKRLRTFSGAANRATQVQVLKERLLSDLPTFERWLSDRPRARRLQRYLLQAGLDWTVSRLVLMSALIGFTAYLAIYSIALQPAFISLLVAAILAALPTAYVSFRRSRRLEKMQQQLPEALDFMTRALRSGHAFTSALLMVGEEIAEPIAGEFRIVHDEINYGVSMQQALTNMSERVPLTDLRYFVVSILIQRDSGGNLTEVLANLSQLIRERLKLFSKIKVLSANGRFSAWTLVLLPFALGGVMNMMNPGFMAPLWTDPIGTTILQVMLTLMVIGVLIMRKIIKIRV